MSPVIPILKLGETQYRAYRGDRGKSAYDHSQITSGNPHGVSWATLLDKPSTFAPSSHGHSQSDISGLVSALAGKEPLITAGTTAQYRRGDNSWQTLNQSAIAGLTTTDSPTWVAATLTGANNTSNAKPFVIKSLNGNTQIKFGWDDQIGGAIDFNLNNNLRSSQAVTFLRSDFVEWFQWRWTGESENKTYFTPRNQLNVTSSFQLRGTSSTTYDREVISFDTSWVDSTDVSRKGRAVFNVFDTATREAFRIEATGSAAAIGFLGATAIARQTTSVASSAIASGSGTSSKQDDTFDGYTVAQVVKALRNYGLLA
jgi:hypothetical protein